GGGVAAVDARWAAVAWPSARGRHRKSRDSAYPYLRAARAAADSSRSLDRGLPGRRVDRPAAGQSGNYRSRAIRGHRSGSTVSENPGTAARLDIRTRRTALRADAGVRGGGREEFVM